MIAVGYRHDMTQNHFHGMVGYGYYTGDRQSTRAKGW